MTIEEIVAKLEEYSEAYYTGNELVDDKTFDLLEEELKRIDPTNPYFSKLREKPFKYGVKVEHPYEFIGSLDKIHAVTESSILKKSSRVWLSAKLDGTSLVTYFKNGELDKAVTRGNGAVGVDVTQHYLAITKKYNVHIPADFTGAIRGEVVFTNNNWQQFKTLHPEAKAPRNSGTGLLNQKEVQPEEELLDYVVYDVVATTIAQFDHWGLLSQFGYPIAPSALLATTDISDETFRIYFNVWSSIYPCDGIVIRDCIPTPELVSHNLYLYEKHQEAYKFQAEIKLCEVKSIEWQLGRTGKLTPVLKIDPVEMSGAIVTSITAHNAETVKKMHLGKGAKILAFRSGEVIPALHETIEPADEVIIPRSCPYCGSRLEYTPTGKDIICTYEGCEGRNKFRIFNFIEQMCKDVKGIGDAFLEDFVKELGDSSLQRPLETLSEFIIACKNHKGKPFNYLGNADNIVAAKVIDIITSQDINTECLLLGFGIKLLGAEAAKKLAKQPATTIELLQALFISDPERAKAAILTALPGQVALSNNVAEATSQISNLLVSMGYENISFIFPKSTETRYYAITGSLSKSRKEIQEEFLAKGWEMTDNLNKAELLITNDPNSNSSKNVKAKQLNKQVLTEEDFRNKYLN